MFQDPLFQSNVLASLCVGVCVFVLAGGQRADSWKQHARCRHHRLCVCVCVCVGVHLVLSSKLLFEVKHLLEGSEEGLNMA